MEQYIKKSAIEAEIERRIANHNKELQHASEEDFVSSWASDEENQKLALTSLLPFLNILEVKELQEATASDRGMAEEIIINLKRVEQDYHLDLTREMEWLRNKTRKGE